MIMKKLIFKTLSYFILTIIFLEIIVRIFHIYPELPVFVINKDNVKTYAPNQEGYHIVGNRRMNFTEYRINKSGYNSYQEFTPTKDKTEIAIIGDSFIDGLHQNYYNSIGKKIETKLNDGTKVFEYGHSGYDLADQLHLMAVYKEQFDLIDYSIIYLKFDNDIKRDTYVPDQYWIDSQYFLTSRLARKIKLLSYLNSIGAFEPLRNLKRHFVSMAKPENKINHKENAEANKKNAAKYLKNFKTLINTYGFDKNKTAFLLDKSKTSEAFLNYCDTMGYKYIDYSETFNNSKKPNTLIYDMHWNNYGRTLIADVIVNYINKQK